MAQRSSFRHGLLVVSLVVAAAFPTFAEDVENKFRIGFATGLFNPQDQVLSDAGNVLVLVNRDLLFEEVFIDPRNDSAVFGALDINPSIEGTFYAQYAATKTFLVEASIGYTEADLGDVEVQAQFDLVVPPNFQPFDFSVYRVPVGKIERVPIQLSGLIRFRPRSSFNPYLGGGIGYAFHGFKVSEAFNELSVNLDGSFGALARLTPATFGAPQLISPPSDSFEDLIGARVDVRDTWEAFFAGGVEYSVKRNWALILDVRWSISSRKAEVGFNGGDDLGVAVPQRTDFLDSEWATMPYGAILIRNGGLIDGGAIGPNGFDRALRDGVPDPGLYYIQGGKVDYGALSFKVGMRYTF